MRNNIILVGINLYPEESSAGLYSTQMAEHLAKDISPAIHNPIAPSLLRRLSTYCPNYQAVKSSDSTDLLSSAISGFSQDRPALSWALITSPAFRLSLPDLLIERFSCRKYCHIFTAAALIWRYKLKYTDTQSKAKGALLIRFSRSKK